MPQSSRIDRGEDGGKILPVNICELIRCRIAWELIGIKLGSQDQLWWVRHRAGHRPLNSVMRGNGALRTRCRRGLSKNSKNR